MKIFATRELKEDVINTLKDKGTEVSVWKEKTELTEDDLIKNCKDADGLLIMGGTEVSGKVMEACKNLKVISLVSVGFDHIDIEAATKHKIGVGHTPDVLSKATADTAFLLMLATSRKAFYHHKRIIDGNWDFYEPNHGLGIDIHGKTLGIFGLGNIGYEMAKLCKNAFNMDIIYHNRSSNEMAEKELGAKKVSFEELLKQSDVLSVHTNLTDETKDKFNAGTFFKMKPTAIFINSGRGGIHNEKDLIKALQDKTIWGAGLDVTNPEPMDRNNPLLSMESVAVLPHIGSATEETREAMMKLALDNLLSGLECKEPPKCVNPEVYKN